MSANIQRIDFHEHEIVSWRDEESGKVVASLKAMCDPLGLDQTTQVKRLQGNPLFAEGLVRGRQIPTPGGKQNMHGLDIELIQLWLASINSSRIKDDKQALLLLYQRECAKALQDYWTTGTATNPRVSTPQPPPLPPAAETLETLRTCKVALEALGCFDDRDKITFGAYVRQIAAMVMQPLLPPGAPAEPTLDLTKPVLWTMSMRLQYLKYAPLSGTDGESLQIKIGTLAARNYRATYPDEPKKMWDYVKGQQRQVNSYEPDRVQVLDDAIATYLGPPRLQIVT